MKLPLKGQATARHLSRTSWWQIMTPTQNAITLCHTNGVRMLVLKWCVSIYIYINIYVQMCMHIDQPICVLGVSLPHYIESLENILKLGN